jgi:hypothetical protein
MCTTCGCETINATTEPADEPVAQPEPAGEK